MFQLCYIVVIIVLVKSNKLTFFVFVFVWLLLKWEVDWPDSKIVRIQAVRSFWISNSNFGDNNEHGAREKGRLWVTRVSAMVFDNVTHWNLQATNGHRFCKRSSAMFAANIAHGNFPSETLAFPHKHSCCICHNTLKSAGKNVSFSVITFLPRLLLMVMH